MLLFPLPHLLLHRLEDDPQRSVDIHAKDWPVGEVVQLRMRQRLQVEHCLIRLLLPVFRGLTRSEEELPYLPLGQYLQATACSSKLTGVLNGFALFWNVRKEA